MKVEFAIMSSEQKVCLSIIPETAFEITFIDRVSNYLPTHQVCCSEKRIIIETKMRDNLK